MSEATTSSKKKNDAAGSGRHVTRATGVVALFTLLSRLLGLLRDIATANYFGANVATDAFFVAFKVPNLLRRLVAEGSLATAFVPVFTDELRLGQKPAQQAVRAVTGFCLALTLLLSGLGIIYSTELTYVFALGWTDQPEKVALASSLLQVMFPYLVLVSLLALASGALNAIGVFASPAAAPAILNIAFISGIVLFNDSLEQPIYILAYALLVGGLLALLPQLWILRKRGFSMRPASPFGSAPVTRLLKLMLPAVISASVYQIMVLVNTTMATMLKDGTQTWLYFADRIFQFPLGVFSLAVATAVLPSFSHLASAGDSKRLSELLSSTLGWIAFITIPATVGLIVLSDPIVDLLYHRGKFTPNDSAMTALALQGYAIGLWSLSSHSILVRAFLSKKNTMLPAMISMLTIGLNVVLAIALMGPPLDADANIATRVLASLQSLLTIQDLSHVGLALAGSLASLISVAGLALLLGKVELQLHWKIIFHSYWRSLLSAAVMIVPIKLIADMQYSSLTTIVSGIPLGVLCFFFTSALLRSEEAALVISRIRRKI